MAARKALLFGANGFVAGHLLAELSGHGYEVFGSDKAEAPRHAALAGYMPAYLTDAAAVAAVVREFGPTHIVNLAAISSVGQSWKAPALTMQVNVVGTINVLEAARALPAPPRVLLVGSSEEYSPSELPLRETDPTDANNPYGISKVAQERLAEVYSERYGIRVYRTRSFNHTGPGQAPGFVLPSWCEQVANIERGGVPAVLNVGNVEVRRDFSDVRDVVKAYRLLIESEHCDEVFNIGSGKAYLLRDLAEMIAGFSSQPVEIEVDSGLLRPSDNPVICCDRSKAGELLGWVPERNIEDTLQEMYQVALGKQAV